MGVTNMPVTTTSEEARKFFNQGVSQVHSFWFLESERSFLQAATLDPNMAMAYWGIAVSAAGDYRPAFQLIRDPSEGGRAGGPEATSGAAATIARSTNGAALSPMIRAREAAEKAMSLRDKVTPRERLYIEAQWARRNPATKTADLDHIAGMRKLVAAHPDDEEAGSMLGLALLDGYDSVTQEAAHEHARRHRAARRRSSRSNDNALRRASLPDSRLRGQRDAGARVARLPALSGARDEHPARAPHAGPHLRAERPDRRRHRGVHGGSGQRARLPAGRRALSERPSRPQRSLPDPLAQSRRPLSGFDEGRRAPDERLQGNAARAHRDQPARHLASGLLRAGQDARALRSGTTFSTARPSRPTTGPSSRPGGCGPRDSRRRSTGQVDKARATLREMSGT